MMKLAMAAEYDAEDMRFTGAELNEWNKRMRVLALRINLLSDATLTGKCDGYKIDSVSAANSEGDWRKTKQADG